MPTSADSDSLVTVDRERSGVAVLTLNHPSTLNALSSEMVDLCHDQLAEIANDGVTRVLVLTGSGRGFCSGHDFDGLATIGAEDSTVQSRLKNQCKYSDLILQVNEFPMPVIAAVNGPAAGGGLALALAADTRLCDETARFNAAFIKVGVSGCDMGISYLLPRIVGPTLAFEMMLTGRLIDAEEALRSNLVLRRVPKGTVVDEALILADAILANGSFAVAMTKRSMWNGLDAASLRHAISLEDRTQVMCLQSGETRQAMGARVVKPTSN
jgi:enoyl-CoA hydratase